MDDPSLVELMTVRPAESDDHFIGQPEAYPGMGLYGGHLIGQALAAGLATVEEPKRTHSLHCYFLKAGDPEVAIEYAVMRLREGRGTDVRTITARQHQTPVFQMTASFKLPEQGDQHQPEMPEVENPDALWQATGTRFEPPPTTKGRARMALASEHFMQPRFVPGREPMLRVWMCCNETRGLSERESQIVLAYLSDGPLMFNSVIPHGLPFQTHRLTSIDHAVWFHRNCDVREWMLFDQSSSAAADGRGMNHGKLFARDGKLILTAAQESMLRRIES